MPIVYDISNFVPEHNPFSVAPVLPFVFALTGLVSKCYQLWTDMSDKSTQKTKINESFWLLPNVAVYRSCATLYECQWMDHFVLDAAKSQVSTLYPKSSESCSSISSYFLQNFESTCKSVADIPAFLLPILTGKGAGDPRYKLRNYVAFDASLGQKVLCFSRNSNGHYTRVFFHPLLCSIWVRDPVPTSEFYSIDDRKSKSATLLENLCLLCTEMYKEANISLRLPLQEWARQYEFPGAAGQRDRFSCGDFDFLDFASVLTSRKLPTHVWESELKHLRLMIALYCIQYEGVHGDIPILEKRLDACINDVTNLIEMARQPQCKRSSLNV